MRQKGKREAMTSMAWRGKYSQKEGGKDRDTTSQEKVKRKHPISGALDRGSGIS